MGLEDWRPTRLTRAQTAQADLILAMDLDVYQRLVMQCPGAARKTTVLGLFAPEPRVVIPDPFVMPVSLLPLAAFTWDGEHDPVGTAVFETCWKCWGALDEAPFQTAQPPAGPVAQGRDGVGSGQRLMHRDHDE